MVKRHTDLDVFNRGYEAAMRVFEISKKFPKAEAYSLTDQVRRSSRSVCANLAEAWRKRKYEAHFVSKLSETEAAETQVWIQFAVGCEYLDREIAKELYEEYDQIIAMLVAMARDSDKWILPS